MKLESFFGGSYESQAFTADCSKLVNWYPELLQDPGATARRILLPTPGVEVISTITADAPGRAHFVQDGREFAVLGAAFYEFGLAGNVLNGVANDLSGPLSAPTLHDTSLPATISSNGDGGGQLFITAGGMGYTYSLTDPPSTASPNFIIALEGKAQFGGMLDGFLLALEVATSKLNVSNLNDGATWTMFAQRSLAPDPWISMRVLGRGIWLLGELTSEVWFNTGDRFPFAPHPSGVLQYGILAPHSAVVAGDDLLWLAGSRSGRVCVMRVAGFEPEIVSTLPLEKTMAGYLGLETAVADSYSENGHVFYRLNFDVDGVTWVYDLTTKLWHEQGTWLAEQGCYTVARQRFHAYAFGEHRILDSANGNLYRMSQDLARDVEGRHIRRLRRAPALSDELRRVYYPEFELDLETGLAEQGCHVSFSMAAVPVIASFNWSKEAESSLVTFTDTSTGSPDTWAWTFGDSSSDTIQNPTHNYTLPGGPFTVTLTATNSSTGGSDVATAILAISLTPPASGSGS